VGSLDNIFKIVGNLSYCNIIVRDMGDGHQFYILVVRFIIMRNWTLLCWDWM